MKKFLVIGFSAFILEVASTMYISTVADKSFYMVFWAFIGPFLGLPFVGYMVDTKIWSDRLKIALSSAIGYFLGSVLVYIIT